MTVGLRGPRWLVPRAADTQLMLEDAHVVRVHAPASRLQWAGWLISGTVFAVFGLLKLPESPAALIIVGVGLLLMAVGVRGLRARVVVSPDEMVVFNVFRNVRVARDSIRVIESWPKAAAPKIAPRVVVRTTDGDAITPTAFQLEGSTTTSDERHAVVRGCVDRLMSWQRTGHLS